MGALDAHYVLFPNARLELRYMLGVTDITHLFDQLPLVLGQTIMFFFALTKPHLEVTLLPFIHYIQYIHAQSL